MLLQLIFSTQILQNMTNLIDLFIKENTFWNNAKDNIVTENYASKTLDELSKLTDQYNRIFEFEFEFWCLTPLSAILQLYHGDQF
jgi:hypothetical protein